MSYHDVIEVCRTELFTAGADIVAQFGGAAAERVMRTEICICGGSRIPTRLSVSVWTTMSVSTGVNINWIVAGQPRDRRLNVIKSFYV